MASDRTVDGRFRREVVYLKEIYKHLPGPGTEKKLSAKDLALNMDLSSHASRYAQHFDEIGLISRRISMGPEGKTSMWSVNHNFDDALMILYKDQDKRRIETHEARVKATSEPRKPRKAEVEDIKAIVGPDAPVLADIMPKEVRDLRKDEPAALIEAARQYANRTLTVQGGLNDLAKKLADLGIAFDIEKAQEAFHFEEDERLETIALVLPTIDRLERQNTTLAEQMASMREKVRDYERMKTENARLVRRVETLVSQRVQAQIQ